ncbi:MAG TPA: hypothetical protein VGJ93_04930 [Desulfuromonadaceae bacterium]
MKRLLLAFVLVLLASGTAMATFFGINIGIPLFYYDNFQAGYYYTPPPVYYNPTPVIIRPFPGRVIDNRGWYDRHRYGDYYRYNGYNDRYYGRRYIVR